MTFICLLTRDHQYIEIKKGDFLSQSIIQADEQEKIEKKKNNNLNLNWYEFEVQ